MSFHLTCELLNISWVPDDATYLNCSARRDDGTYAGVKLRLDDYLGNSDGEFTWYSKTRSEFEDTGRNFTKSAVHVTWTLEEDDSIFVLNASLKNENGEATDAKVVLTGRFENFDGRLTFIDEFGNPDFGDQE